MLTDQELLELATAMESDRVEHQESLAGSSKDKIGQAICAFANDLPAHGKPGVVLIGVDDAGKAVGLEVTDRLLQELAAFRSDGNILPLPNLTVEKRQIMGQDVAVVVVQPSADPPVRYYGQVWVRVGPRRAIASRDEERVLAERRRAGDVPFDRRSPGGVDLGALNLELFKTAYLPAAVSREVLEESERSVEEQLLALHLLASSGSPSHGALLLLGRSPRAWLPGAYVQFARFDGTSLTDPVLDQKELDGRLSDILLRMDDLAAINIRIETVIEGVPVEQRQPDYPLGALQQLLRNAVLHRTYEVNAPVYWYWFNDRVEIHSPGGLYGRVTEHNFGWPGSTDYRNPTLAEGLKVLGFLRHFGEGIRLARKRCFENGNSEPAFDFSPSAVLVTVCKRSRRTQDSQHESQVPSSRWETV